MKLIRQIILSILTLEAKLVLAKYKPEVIAITGNVGKTSTKDVIFEVVKSLNSARKSQKSYNSEIGIPLAILGRDTAWGSLIGWIANVVVGLRLVVFGSNYPKTLVLEAGADRPGDIEKIVKLLNPHIAVVTAVGEVPVHIEFFAGPAELAREKAKILEGLQSTDFAILNFDDLAVLKMRRETKSRVLTFGFGEGANVRATDYKIMYEHVGDSNRPQGITFKVNYNGSVVPIRIFETFGKPQVYAALAAVAVGVVKEINLVKISEALSGYRAPAGRMRMIPGIKQSWILDDSYNASPAATHAALDLLREFPATRKVAVLGDMLELGGYTELAHRAVGRQLLGVDVLITVGFRAKFIVDEVRKYGQAGGGVLEFLNSEDAAETLKKIIEPGDLVLIKGSQAMRMEKVVEAVMAHPDKAVEMLVRQEKEWKN